jgi:HD-GYP domain-containing protein (c-di-GMP phosphodiesterase class II)
MGEKEIEAPDEQHGMGQQQIMTEGPMNRQEATSLQRRLGELNNLLKTSGLSTDERYSDQVSLIQDMAGGNLTEGNLSMAERKTQGLMRIRREVQQLERLNAEPEYIRATVAAFNDYGTKTQSRANHIHELNKIRIESNEVWNTRLPGMQGARNQMNGLISSLGTAATERKDYTQQFAQQVGQQIQVVRDTVQSARALHMEMNLHDFTKITQELEAMRNQRDASSKYKEEIEKFYKKAREAQKKVSDGKKVENYEQAEIQTTAEFIRSADAALEGIQSRSGTAVASTVYANAMEALGAGKPEEAKVQFFLAKETAEVADISKSRREKIADISERLAQGKITGAQAIKEMGGYLAGRLKVWARIARKAGLKDEQITASISAIMENMKGAGTTLEDLERGKIAVSMIKLSRRIAKIPRSARKGALDIFRRGLKALEIGLPLDYAKMQEKLAEMYIESGDLVGDLKDMGVSTKELISARRQEIEKVSKLLERGQKLHAIHMLVKEHGLSPEEAARRLFGKGEDSKAIADMYKALGDDVEKEIMRIASFVSLFTGAKEELGVLTKLQRKWARIGGGLGFLFNSLTYGMEDVLQRMAEEEEVDGYDTVILQAIPKFYDGEKSDIVAFFSSMLGMGRGVARTEGLDTIKNVLSKLKGKAKDKTANIYSMAADAINDRNPKRALALMTLAQAYAQGNKEDRKKILDLADKLAGRTIGIEKAGWLARVFFERTRSEIHDEGQKQTFLAYSELAISAYEDGDKDGASLLGKLAILYGTAAKFDPELKAVKEVLGIAKGEGGLPPIEQIQQEMKTGKSVLDVLKLKAKDLEFLYLRLAGVELSLNEVEFENEIAMGKFNLGATGKYSSEKQRFDSKEKRTKDEIEDRRLKREAVIADPKETFKRLDEARSTYSKGAEIMKKGLDKRLLAFSVKDEAVKAHMIAEADVLVKKGQALVEIAETELQALTGIHKSISKVRTLRREQGRSHLFLAFNTLDRIADDIEEDENITDVEYDGHQIRMQQTYADLKMGTFHIDAQLRIQGIKKSLIEQGRKLTKQNESNSEEYGEISLPNKPGDEGPTESAYNKEERQKEINKGILYAKRERFKGSARQYKISATSMALDLQLVDISARYWGLKKGANKNDKQYGMQYFRTQEYLKGVETARGLAYKGQISKAEEMLQKIRSTAIIDGAKQRYHFQARMLREYESMLMGMARKTRNWEKEAPEGMDEPSKIAYMEMVKGIKDLGIIENIAADQEAEAKKFGDLAKDAIYARDMTNSVKDVIETKEDVEILGAAMFGALFRYWQKTIDRAQQRGSYGREYYFTKRHLRAMKDDFVDGNYEEIVKYIKARPLLMETATMRLVKERRLGFATSAGLVVESKIPEQIEGYQDRNVGWGYAMTLTGRALETLNYADMLYRARVGTRMRRNIIRHDANALLIGARWASTSPGKIKEYILTNRNAYVVGSDRQIYFRRNSGIYEDVKIEMGSDVVYLADLLRSKTHSLYNHLQIINQGHARAPEPTTERQKAIAERIGSLNYRLLFGKHRAAGEVSDLDYKLTMAGLGFVKDTKHGGWKIKKMSKEEHEVLIKASESIGKMRGQYLNITASLKRFTSTDDAYRAFEALGDLAEKIDKIVEEHDAKGGPTPKILEDIKKLTDSTMKEVEEHVKEGISDDKILGYVEAGFKIIGAGLLTATGFGAPVAAYFLAESVYGFSESIIMSGGYDYMSTEQKILSWGSVGLAALGVGVSGMSSISNTLASTGRTAGSLNTMIRAGGYTLIGGGVVMGSVQIADMYMNNPDADALDYGFAFFNAAQPFMQMGATRVARLSPNLAHSNTFGAKAYRGFMMTMFGVGRDELISAGMLGYNRRYSKAVKTLDPDVRVQIDKIEGSMNRSLEPGEIGSVLKYFEGKPMNIEEAASILKRYEQFVGTKMKGTLTEKGTSALIEVYRIRPLESAETLLLLEKFGDKIPKPAKALAFLDSHAKSGGKYYDIVQFAKDYPDTGVHGTTSARGYGAEVEVLTNVAKRSDAKESLNYHEQQVMQRINGLVDSRNMTRQQAIEHVADERVHPHKVELNADLRAMPKEFYSMKVPTVDGGEMTLSQAPRGTLHTQRGEGAGGTVYFGEMTINGKRKEVAIKVFKDAQVEADGSHDWSGRFKYDIGELKNLKILSELGIGPEVYGFVDVDGNYAIAMERIHGKAIDDMSVAEIRQHVSDKTYKQLGAQWKKLTDAGYTIGDFQFAVLTKDQTINGVQRKAGDVVFWDAGALITIKENGGKAHNTAEGRVSQAQVLTDVMVMADFLKSTSPKNMKILEAFANQVTGLRQRGPEAVRRLMLIKRGERALRCSKQLESINNPKIEKALRQVEAETGIQLLLPEGTVPPTDKGPGPGPKTGGSGGAVVDATSQFAQKQIDNLKLTDPISLTEFGCRLLSKDAKVRAEAQKQLELMGRHPAASIVKEMTGDSRLADAVSNGDEVGIMRFRKNNAAEYASRIGGPGTEPGQAAMRATGTDDAKAVGRVVKGTGIPEGTVVAMAGGKESKPKKGGPHPPEHLQPEAGPQEASPTPRARTPKKKITPSEAEDNLKLYKTVERLKLKVEVETKGSDGEKIVTTLNGAEAAVNNINDNSWIPPQNETHAQMNQNRAATRAQMEQYFQGAAHELGWSKEAIQKYSEAFVSLLDVSERNGYTTYGHTLRAAEYTDMMLNQMEKSGIKLSATEKAEIRLAALIHDVGKIAVPNELWRFEGKPNAEQTKIMETHARQSTNIANGLFENIGLVDAAQFKRISEMAGYHQEFFDGTRYSKLKGEKIPLGSRVIALADAYDAMRSVRSYRKGMPLERAVRIIKENSENATQFDPQLGPIFIEAVTGQKASD